jgi:hypothetical protein
VSTTIPLYPSRQKEATLPRVAASRFNDPATRHNRSSLLVPLTIWAIFLIGLSLQLFSPHLQIAHDSFVIPQDLVHPGTPLDPHALVQKERIIQSFSALLVLVGAVGLAFYYRRTLLKSFSGKSEN